MRKLARPDVPPCLRDNASLWTEEYVRGRADNPAYPFRWRSEPCYQAIRASLAAMTQKHCAFCDGGLGVTSRETVEHFRPKKSFPSQAYAWDNLFPCCDLCQSMKGERFDEGLLKPDAADYRFPAYFTVNYRTGEIEVSPQADADAQTRARVTIKLYGLNRPELNKARRRELECFERSKERHIDDFNYRYFLE